MNLSEDKHELNGIKKYKFNIKNAEIDLVNWFGRTYVL